MMIGITTNILTMAQDLILIHNFHRQMEAWETVIIFGVVDSSSVHIASCKKNILVLGEGPIQGLDNATITAGAKYPIDST